MFLSRRANRLAIELDLAELQKRTRILFVDDEDRSDVIDYLRKENWKCRQLSDIDTLENTEIKDAHIVCVDIKGVGRILHKENEGLDLVVSIRSRYPEKKIILYSSSPIHNIFHQANEMLDKRIYKRSGDLEVFRSAIQELSRKCFVWSEVVSYAYGYTKPHLPNDMSQEEFAKIMTRAVLSRRNWSLGKMTRVLAAGANVAQIVQLLIQLFSSGHI